MANDKLSRSKDLAARVVYAALQILKEKGGQAPRKDLIEEVPKRVELDAWARTVYEKTGYFRWQSVLSFFSVDYLKAGFLLKNKGLWYLTPEGEKALEPGPADMLRAAQAAYYKWKAQKDANADPEAASQDEQEDADAPPQQNPTATLDQTQELASTGLKDQINLRNAYEFQDLVAALLRGMGYYTPFVAPKGKDGGVDVIAYRDPLGTISPRIKVQIKHRESTASVQEVRQLMGLLQKGRRCGHVRVHRRIHVRRESHRARFSRPRGTHRLRPLHRPVAGLLHEAQRRGQSPPPPGSDLFLRATQLNRSGAIATANDYSETH